MSTPSDPKTPPQNEQKGFPQPRAPIRTPFSQPRQTAAQSASHSLPSQDPYRQYWAGPKPHPCAKELKQTNLNPNKSFGGK